jgi:methylamine dehydrogenase light chain
VLSAELGMAFRVGKLPYAVLLDEAGRVRAKGLVNSREQLESLFTAKELERASVQEFVTGPHGASQSGTRKREHEMAGRFLRALERAARRSSVSRRSALVGSAVCWSALAFTLPVLPFDRIARPPPAARGGGKKKAPHVTTATTGATARSTASCAPAAAARHRPARPEPKSPRCPGSAPAATRQDGKDYLISYNDCCGKTACGRCLCNTNLGERPAIAWACTTTSTGAWPTTSSTMFHCTTSVIVGLAQ